MKKELAGYLTVEASMLMPLVVLLYIWVIAMMFYQYDRTLLEQDATILLVTQGNQKEWDRSKYMWCDVEAEEISSGKTKQSVSLKLDFTGPYFDGLTATSSATEVDRVFLLRQKRKLDNWIENKETE